MRNELVKLLKDTEREVRDLKSAGRQAGLLKCYSFRLSPTEYRGLDHVIVYDDGDQPIISEFYSASTIMPFEPDKETNRQHFRHYAQAQYPITIVATRPILRVESYGTSANGPAEAPPSDPSTGYN